MRAYSSQRFKTTGPISTMRRATPDPELEPVHAWPAFQEYVDVEWLQFVPFLELGRVAPSWELDELHSDMKWSAAFGIRPRPAASYCALIPHFPKKADRSR
jgi:hypothetical protein